MLRQLANLIRQKIIAGRIPEGKAGLRVLGHRLYVGGQWDRIGKLQFDFLVEQGLQPQDCFLDVACGALRGGVHFIRYLEPGNYLGIDKEEELIKAGIEKELGEDLLRDKAPEFVVSDCFDFKRFSKKPQFSLAISLFTHLNPQDIESCLGNLRQFIEPGHRFFATFFEGDSTDNQSQSHSLGHFEYSKDEMIRFGSQQRWESVYLGDWNHPRDQMMMEYIAR